LIVPVAVGTSYTVGQGACFEQRFYHSIPYNVCVIKATYRLLEGRRLKLLEPQPALVALDIPEYPDRDYCSPRYVSDFTPYKPNSDIVICGDAKAHGSVPTTAWLAELSVGNLRKALKLSGMRQWQHRALRGWQLSEYEPTASVPLAYELAYGGIVGDRSAPKQVFSRNPLGVGFVGGERLDTDATYPACQIEYLDDPLRHIAHSVKPAGFSPMPGYFEDRLQHAGSVEKQPENSMPSDMDMRFWNCAPSDQRLNGYLSGGETIQMSGFWPEGVVEFTLPQWTAMSVSIDDRDNRVSHAMALDTVHIDLDKRHVSLRWCTLIPFDIDGNDVTAVNLIGIPRETQDAKAVA
jgi:hypothetical protein